MRHKLTFCSIGHFLHGSKPNIAKGSISAHDTLKEIKKNRFISFQGLNKKKKYQISEG